MKGHWEDRDIEKVLKAMRDVRPPDAGWGDRAWAGIEGRLAGKPSPWAAVFGPASVRWAVAAACLVLAVTWTVQQRRAREVDLGGYLANLYIQKTLAEDEGEIGEPILLTDGSDSATMDQEAEESNLPSVYDTMLEL